MAEEQRSLIAADDARRAAQPTLFELGESATAPLVSSGQYTGELLFKSKPDTYRAVVAALGEGMGTRQIARAYGVHFSTVRAIREREFAKVQDEKATTAKLLRQFSRMGAERLVEELDDIHVDKLPLAIAIAIDKAQLLDGEATARIATINSYDPRSWNDLVAGLPEIPVHGTDTTLPPDPDGTGLVGGESGQSEHSSGE
jgi:hypothetical protein